MIQFSINDSFHLLYVRCFFIKCHSVILGESYYWKLFLTAINISTKSQVFHFTLFHSYVSYIPKPMDTQLTRLFLIVTKCLPPELKPWMWRNSLSRHEGEGMWIENQHPQTHTVIFWVMTLCSLVRKYQRVGKIYCIHFKSRSHSLAYQITQFCNSKHHNVNLHRC
jgi:hypothetical protein